ARETVARADHLSGEADCPLCGQALGDAFEQVRRHREEEEADAAARVSALEQERPGLAAVLTEAAAASEAAERAAKDAAEARARYDAARARRESLEQALAAALAAVNPPPAPDERVTLRLDVERRRAAAARCQELAGRLHRRDAAAAELDTERQRVGDTQGRLEALRAKVRSV